MRWVLAAALAGCTAQAAPPFGGGGSAPQSGGDMIGTSSTLAQCQAMTPAEGDLCFPTDSPYTMVARSAGTWSYRYPGIGFDVTLPPSGGWTTRNSASITAVGGTRRLTFAASTGINIKGETRALPASPPGTAYWVEACVAFGQRGGTGQLGGFWFQASDSKLTTFFSADESINHQDFTDYATFAANNANVTGEAQDGIWCWRQQENATVRLVYSGTTATNSTTSTSVWDLVGTSDARTNHITADAIGWGGYPDEADTAANWYLVHWATGTYTP